MLAAALLGALKVEGEWVGHAVMFLGGGFGGFFAGRASPGKTIIEPALAGALLIVTFILLFLSIPGSRALFAADSGAALVGSLKVGFITALGGLAGAVLGERSSPPVRSASALRWMGLSGLITLGVMVFLLLVIGIVTLRSGTIGDSGGVAVLILALSALVGGGITQAIAPRKMCFAAGSGFIVVILASIGLAIAGGGNLGMGEALVGLFILGAIGTLIGALGARIAWGMVGDRVTQHASHEQTAAGMPSARIQSK
jgi:hypothetical protein